jgi:hypothetical protein
MPHGVLAYNRIDKNETFLSNRGAYLPADGEYDGRVTVDAKVTKER